MNPLSIILFALSMFPLLHVRWHQAIEYFVSCCFYDKQLNKSPYLSCSFCSTNPSILRSKTLEVIIFPPHYLFFSKHPSYQSSNRTKNQTKNHTKNEQVHNCPRKSLIGKIYCHTWCICCSLTIHPFFNIKRV